MFLVRVFVFLVLLIGLAHAQSSGGFIQGQTLTAAQLNSAFSTKFDFPSSTLVMPTTDGSNFKVQNGPKSALDIYGPSGPLRVYDNIRSAIDIEPGTTVQNYTAYGAWIWNNVVWNPVAGTAGVGIEAYCVNIVANAACFGINPALTDSYDASIPHSVASKLAGGELDFATYNTGTTVTGFGVALQGVQPAGANIIEAIINPATAARWTNGFTIADGALANGGAGLLLGMQGVSSGAGISSGSIVFNMTDSASVEHHIFVQAQPGEAGKSTVAFSDTGGPAAITIPTIYGGLAAGSGLNLQSTFNGAPSSDYVKMTVGGATIFDCNLSFAGYCTVRATNGLALNNANVIQVNEMSINNMLLATAAPTVSAGQFGLGSTTVAPNTATCPTGTVGGKTVVGCWVVNVAGTTQYLPYF